MIKPLRKRHLQVWIILAILLPAGIIAATIAVPSQRYDRLLQPASAPALPVIVRTGGNENYTINIRSNNEKKALQLEWIVRETLTAPSALLYQLRDAKEDISNALLIGRIQDKGTYHFALKNDTGNQAHHFVLYDIIHHKIIYSFTI